MKSASEHAIKLISSWKRATHKEVILATLFKEDAVYESVDERISELFGHLGQNDGAVFRADVVESLLVLRYSEAIQVLETIEKSIRERSNSRHHPVRPEHVHGVILGAVRAANWAAGERESPSFDKALPAAVARLIGLMARIELFTKERQHFWGTPENPDELRGSLATYLYAKKFGGDAEIERSRRCRIVLKGLDTFELSDPAMKYTQPVVEEVVHAALDAIPLHARISILAKAQGKEFGDQGDTRLRSYSVVSGVYVDPEHHDELSIAFASERDASDFLQYYRFALRGDGLKNSDYLDNWGRHAEITGYPVIPSSDIKSITVKLSSEQLRLVTSLVERIATIHSIPLEAIALPEFGQRHGATTFYWMIPAKLAE